MTLLIQNIILQNYDKLKLMFKWAIRLIIRFIYITYVNIPNEKKCKILKYMKNIMIIYKKEKF